MSGITSYYNQWLGFMWCRGATWVTDRNSNHSCACAGDPLTLWKTLSVGISCHSPKHILFSAQTGRSPHLNEILVQQVYELDDFFSRNKARQGSWKYSVSGGGGLIVHCQQNADCVDSIGIYATPKRLKVKEYIFSLGLQMATLRPQTTKCIFKLEASQILKEQLWWLTRH